MQDIIKVVLISSLYFLVETQIIINSSFHQKIKMYYNFIDGNYIQILYYRKKNIFLGIDIGRYIKVDRK